MKSKIILISVLVLGFILRILFVTKLPMYGDELTLAYDTYSILKTGHDQTGQFLPIIFSMRGHSPGGYVYASVPFVAIFGPTAIGIRLLSILSGLGIILLIYYLGKKLLNESVGLVASFLAAISPWDIYLSRGGFETHFALFLALAGVLAFLHKKYLWWAVTWGIAIFTYPTFKLTLPLMFVLLIMLGGIRKIIRDKIFILGLIVLMFFGGLTIWETFRSSSEERFLSINIFADQDLKQMIIQRVNNERNISTLPQVLKPVFINREIEYGRILFENYVKNISPDFLILRGDGNPRHNPGEMGMIYIIDLPLILIALTFLWREKRKEFILLSVWILITPLATMLFSETHGLRSDLMIPPLVVLSAYAITKIPRRLVYLVSILIFVQLTYILVRIYFIAPAKFASFWSADAKAAAQSAIQESSQGKKVVLSTKQIDNIEYAYEVYAKLDPNVVISQFGKFPKVFGNVVITDK